MNKIYKLFFIFGMMLSGSTAFSADLDAYWPLDNSTDDVSGNNHNLQNGTVTFPRLARSVLIRLHLTVLRISFNTVIVPF